MGRNPFSWAKPRLFGDFGQTSLTDNSIGCYLALVLAALFGDKKWPIRTLSPHYLEPQLELPSYILGSVHCMQFSYHFFQTQAL